MRRNTWRPAQLIDADTVSLTSVLAVVAFLYSADYLTGDDKTTGSLNVIEMAAPLWLWGTCVGVFGVVLLVGILQRVHRLVWLGHMLLFCTYTLIGAGSIQSAIVNGGDGLRGAGIVGFCALMHVIFALRMGTRPLEPRQAQPSDVVYASAEAPTRES